MTSFETLAARLPRIEDGKASGSLTANEDHPTAMQPRVRNQFAIIQTRRAIENFAGNATPPKHRIERECLRKADQADRGVS